MPKRISDKQRLISYAMQASAELLQDAIETLKAIQSSRFPRAKATRKPRTPAVDKRQPELPAMPKEESQSAGAS